MDWGDTYDHSHIRLITMVGRRTEAQNAIKHPSALMAAKGEMKMNGILEMTAFDNLL